jgi:putative phage-type endonuclease
MSERIQYEVVCDQGDECRWLAARNSGIGASEISVLLGESEWMSNLELYYRKIGEDEGERSDNELMLWGRLLEPAIRDEVARRADVTLLDAPARLLRSKVRPWAIATPDAITTPAGEPVEVKNLSHGYDPEGWAVQVPEKYMLQAQHQMLVTGAERCLFGALLWGSRLIWEWIPRDEQRVRHIIAAGDAFWHCVEARTPPPSDGNPGARKVLARRVAELPDGEPVELFESDVGDKLAAFELAKSRHERAVAAEKSAKRQLEATKDELAQALGDTRHGVTSSGWSLRWKTSERRGYTVQPATLHQFEIKPPKEQ